MEERFPAAALRHSAYLRHQTKLYARRVGLPEEDAKDCAVETEEGFLLQAHLPIPADWPQEKVKRWLDTRAWHSALDYRKQYLRQQDHKRPLSEGDAALQSLRHDAADRPDARVLGSEFGERFFKAFSRLCPTEQELIYRRCFLKESTKEVAATLCRSSHAVEEALSHAKKRLRGFLQEEKLDMAECLDYLGAMRGH